VTVNGNKVNKTCAGSLWITCCISLFMCTNRMYCGKAKRATLFG